MGFGKLVDAGFHSSGSQRVMWLVLLHSQEDSPLQEEIRTAYGLSPACSKLCLGRDFSANIENIEVFTSVHHCQKSPKSAFCWEL